MADGNLERITVLLQARDRDFARAMDRNNRLIARLNRDGSRNMRQMTTTVESQLSRMKSSAADFGTSFARGLAFGAAPAAVALISRSLRGAVSELSALGKQARDTGLDVETLQGLMRGFARGTNMDEAGVGQAFEQFNRRIGDAIAGTGPLAATLDRYGIVLRRNNGEMKTQAELLDDIATAMRNARNEQERAAIGNAAFGRDGRRMADLMAGGPEVLREMEAEARAAGDIIDSNLIHRAEILDDKFDQLTRRVKTFFQTLAVGAMGGTAETPIDTLNRLFGDPGRARSVLGEELFNALIEGAGELADETERAVSGIADLADGMQRGVLRFSAGMADITGQLSDLGMIDEILSFDRVIVEMEQLVSDLRAGRIGVEEFDAALDEAIESAAGALEGFRAIDGVDVSGAVDAINTLKGALSATRAEALALRSELPGDPYGMTDGAPLSGVTMPQDLLTGRRASPPERPPNNIDFGMPPARRGGGGGGGTTNPYAGAVEDIQARTQALELEAAALIAVANSGREYGNAVDFARTKADLMQRAMEAGREITPELEAQIDALAEAYVAAGQAAQEAAAQMEEAQASAERGADAVTDLFLSFTKGSDAAKAALAQLLIQLARVQMQQAILGLGGGKGGGFLSMLGGMLTGRAGGGGVRAGEPYRINENTPNSEIMVPSRSGGVLNVAQAKDALRGQGGAPVVNFHVDARGAQMGVAEQIRRELHRATPQIVTQSVQATHESFREFKPG